MSGGLESLHNYLAFIYFGCGVCLFLFACSQLLVRNKQALHYWMFFDCLFLSYLLMYFWAVSERSLPYIPAALASSEISGTFCMVPFLYAASQAILWGGAPPIRRFGLYLIPPAVFALGFGLYNFLTRPGSWIGTAALPGHFFTPFLAWAMTAACVSVTVALSLGLVAAWKLRRGSKTAPSLVFKTQVIFLIIYLAESLPLLVACVQRSDRLLDLVFAMIGLSAVVFTLTCTSVVYFSGAEASPLRGIGQARPDWDLGAGEIAAKLEQAMKSTAAYRHADLRLDQLARLSKVEPRRLSYYFKANLGTNFRGYLNGLRLRAVCRDLRAKPFASILDIAMENGFSSKSSFNSLFVKAYGMTPREYRSRHLP